MIHVTVSIPNSRVQYWHTKLPYTQGNKLCVPNGCAPRSISWLVYPTTLYTKTYITTSIPSDVYTSSVICLSVSSSVYTRSISLLAYPVAVYTRSISLLVYPAVVYTKSISLLVYPMTHNFYSVPNFSVPKAVSSKYSLIVHSISVPFVLNRSVSKQL